LTRIFHFADLKARQCIHCYNAFALNKDLFVPHSPSSWEHQQFCS